MEKHELSASDFKPDRRRVQGFAAIKSRTGYCGQDQRPAHPPPKADIRRQRAGRRSSLNQPLFELDQIF